MKLHNTLTGKIEEFKSIEAKKARLYHCGPTVYDYPHIGNLRSYIMADILRRGLEFSGYEVTQVINITDFGHLTNDSDDGEDKIMKGLKREGKAITMAAMKELTNFYTERYVENLTAMNIKHPQFLPKASEHIAEDIALIETLKKKGFVYETSDGLYFDTAKDPEYGKLSKKLESAEELQSRIGTKTEKKNPRDFAVWKFSTNDLGFDSTWGKGWPGWHIECSAMAMKYLGEHFDIHTGGVDHIPVHHNNEIAQSESATGKPFANYWLHNAHVIINSEKMSKSLGNYFTLQTLQENGIDPLSYRYWLLTAHYATQMNFTQEAVLGSQTAYKKLLVAVAALPAVVGTKPISSYVDKFTTFINDNLNTPKAIALVWDLLKNSSFTPDQKRATIALFDKVLGLKLLEQEAPAEKLEIPKDIQTLVTARAAARIAKDWDKSDELRDAIKAKGYEVKDGNNGQQVSKI
jgi:cysteinyl-tRNA synthetase